MKNKNQKKQTTYTRFEAEKWLDENFPNWNRIDQGFRWVRSGVYIRYEDDYGERFFGLTR